MRSFSEASFLRSNILNGPSTILDSRLHASSPATLVGWNSTPNWSGSYDLKPGAVLAKGGQLDRHKEGTMGLSFQSIGLSPRKLTSPLQIQATYMPHYTRLIQRQVKRHLTLHGLTFPFAVIYYPLIDVLACPLSLSILFVISISICSAVLLIRRCRTPAMLNDVEAQTGSSTIPVHETQVGKLSLSNPLSKGLENSDVTRLVTTPALIYVSARTILLSAGPHDIIPRFVSTTDGPVQRDHSIHPTSTTNCNTLLDKLGYAH